MAEPCNALSALRAATHDVHQRLESVPLFARLLSSEVTRDDYIQALIALQGLYAGFETTLINGLQQHAPDYPYIARLPLLHRDLSQLGYALALNPSLPPASLPSMATTLGTLYVIEGSMLGGKRLMGHLQSRLSDAVSSALAFYGINGNIEGHWAVTQVLLRDNLRALDAIEQAVAAARQTFLLFINVAEETAQARLSPSLSG